MKKVEYIYFENNIFNNAFASIAIQLHSLPRLPMAPKLQTGYAVVIAQVLQRFAARRTAENQCDYLRQKSSNTPPLLKWYSDHFIELLNRTNTVRDITARVTQWLT